MTNEGRIQDARDAYQTLFADNLLAGIDPIGETMYVHKVTKIPLQEIITNLLFDVNRQINKDQYNYKFYRQIYKRWIPLIQLLCKKKEIPFPHILEI